MPQTWHSSRRRFLGSCAAGLGALGLTRLASTPLLATEQTSQSAKADFSPFFTSPTPALQRRGLMLDISRCRVPSMDTLHSLVQLLAALRFNELQLYLEHSFAYKGHEVVWKDASPMTAEEIRTLDGWCREAGIDLVPNQNSLGHMERWLKHPAYATLAESPKGAMAPWGFIPYASTMKPGPETEALLKDLYGQLLPNFSSKRFNVGCDEPYDLGQGASKERCEREGRGNVFFDHLDAVRRLAGEHGKRIEFWADVLFEEKTIALERIPNDATALVWGYEANHPFNEQAAAVVAKNIAWQACPGDSSWCSLGGRLHTARANIANASEVALRLKAEGLLQTHWGDGGHWQPWATMLPGLILASTAAWNGVPCDWSTLAKALDQVTGDTTGNLSKALVALGRIDELHASNPKNRSLFWEAFFAKAGASDLAKRLASVDTQRWHYVDEELSRIDNLLQQACPATGEGRQLKDEAGHSLLLLRTARSRIPALIDGKSIPDGWAAQCAHIEAEHRKLWLRRHRPGGLEESCGKLRETYQG